MQNMKVHPDVIKEIHESLVRVEKGFKKIVDDINDNHTIEPENPYEAEIWKVVLGLVQKGSAFKMIQGMMESAMTLDGKEEECDGNCKQCETGHEIESHLKKLFGEKDDDECGDDCPPDHFKDSLYI